MITITESEAFIYDLLAGLVVKVNHNPDSEALKGRLMVLDNEIQQQVGTLLHEQVCASEEYRRLIGLLDDIYVRNDLIKTRPPTGEDMAYTDGKVGDRWHAKAALQTKWFSHTALTEVKFGYAK